jgi:RNA polymerase sigma-B factor
VTRGDERRRTSSLPLTESTQSTQTVTATARPGVGSALAALNARFRTAPELLPAEQTVVDDCLDRLCRMDASDPERVRLRERVVHAQLPLVHHLAQRFRGRGESYDDLVQVGTIGLLKALDRFDPARGAFSTFAVPTIVGEIRRHFRDRGWALRVPRRLQELGRRVAEDRELLTHELGRSPTVEEISRQVDADMDLVVEALELSVAFATVPLPTTPEEANHPFLGGLDDALQLVEDRETLRPLLARLPSRERRILALRFGRGLSQSQIAAEIGISQMHVSRLLSRSMTKLREELTEEA